MTSLNHGGPACKPPPQEIETRSSSGETRSTATGDPKIVRPRVPQWRKQAIKRALPYHVGNAVTAAIINPDCKLPTALRLFVLTLAHLATWRTGYGFAGQDTIAASMGVNSRRVRQLRDELEARTDSPVIVEWGRRSRADGSRSSDGYQLSLRHPPNGAANRQSSAGSLDEPTGNLLPTPTGRK